MSDSGNTPSPSTVPSTTSSCVSTTATRTTPITTKSPIPTSLSEWQLLAVLQKANLVQYYDIFISQGGDDINQIMQCDESEFLEIMSLVGMLSKPLHVRRLQRTLNDFSKDPAAFNLAAIPLIGAPPMPNFPAGGNPIDFLLPGAVTLGAALQQSPSPSLFSTETIPAFSTSSAATSTTKTPIPTPVPITAIDFTNPISAIGATANVLSGDYLQTLMASAVAQQHQQQQQQSVTTKFNEHNITTANSKDPNSMRITKSGIPSSSSSPHISSTDDYVALGDFDPNGPQTETPTLSEAQVRRLLQCATALVQNLPKLAPKLVQNKKRISQEIIDVMTGNPPRVDDYRKFSAIYGRFDAKRKPEKILTLHEVSVNEAAAQLCMLSPVLLTRRDELFPLARQVVKDAGYHYTKSRERKRKEDNDGADSSPSISPAPSLNDDDEQFEEKRRRLDVVS